MGRGSGDPRDYPDVPCKGCGDPIPYARAIIAITEGLCADCKRPRLRTSLNARTILPEYETKTLEAKAASYDRHGDARSVIE